MKSPHVVSPELSAFLAVQMDVLGDLALRLGDDSGALKWRRQAAELADRMYHKLFRNDLPIPIDADTGYPIICESLLPYLSLLASDFLPKSCTEKMRDVILNRDYLTPYGFASEKVTSPEYLEDGYWCGAVWPPVALLLVDALDSLGEREMAKEAAAAYCTTVEQNGFSENYSSRTGHGLRDRAYTWAASVWILLTEYVHRETETSFGHTVQGC